MGLIRQSGILAFLTILLLSGCSTGSPGAPDIRYTPDSPVTAQPDGGGDQSVDSRVIVTVNGQPITMETFSRELARFEAGQVALGFEIADPSGYRQQILDLLIEQELLRQMAAEQGIVVTEEQIDAELSIMIGSTGQEYFDSWLTTNYYTEAEFREVLRLELLTNALLEPVIEAVPEVVQHVHARHILVNSDMEAQALLARIRAGEDFAELAATHSVDVTTRDRGGDLGWFPRGGLLVPEVEEIAFSQAPGQISEVVPTAWGYHIVQTLEFDDNRQVESETYQRLLELAIEQWRLALRDGAVIEQLISL